MAALWIVQNAEERLMMSALIAADVLTAATAMIILIRFVLNAAERC